MPIPESAELGLLLIKYLNLKKIKDSYGVPLPYPEACNDAYKELEACFKALSDGKNWEKNSEWDSFFHDFLSYRRHIY